MHTKKPLIFHESKAKQRWGVNMAEALRRIGGNDPGQEFFRNNQQLK
ncbi:hypothetical protein [Desulfosporosinus sp. OT]|nr:hypothetical protein [Desulfosporosinus sp. OT]EGW41411.1 hypothetical protein DOT_0436 [Desulfosporosinus sp. OT]